jgi:hypothetical protein
MKRELLVNDPLISSIILMEKVKVIIKGPIISKSKVIIYAVLKSYLFLKYQKQTLKDPIISKSNRHGVSMQTNTNFSYNNFYEVLKILLPH